MYSKTYLKRPLKGGRKGNTLYLKTGGLRTKDWSKESLSLRSYVRNIKAGKFQNLQLNPNFSL